MEDNAVGWLQNFCVARNWPKPTYTTKGESGQHHEKKFIIECKLRHYSKLGTARTKQEAKQEAATKLRKYLEQQKIDDNEPIASTSNCIGKIRVRRPSEINRILEEQGAVAREKKRPGTIIGMKYLEIPSREGRDKYGCLVRMLTTPISICYGSGASRMEAEINATQGALDLFRLIDDFGNIILTEETSSDEE